MNNLREAKKRNTLQSNQLFSRNLIPDQDPHSSSSLAEQLRIQGRKLGSSNSQRVLHVVGSESKKLSGNKSEDIEGNFVIDQVEIVEENISTIKRCEQSLIFKILKSFTETLVMLLLGAYFLLMYYLDKDDKFRYAVVPQMALQFALLLMVAVPQIGINGLKMFFRNRYLVVECSVIVLTLIFDIYEVSQSFSERIHILVGFGRVLRLVLFSVLITEVEQTLVDNCGRNRKSEISAVEIHGNVDTLLKDLYQRCSSREKLVKAGLKRSLFLYKKDKSKLMSKNRLNDSSLQGDEEEIDPMKIQELKMKEISKALIVLESKEEKYFQEGFNFATMESQYTLKMVLESAKDLEFDVFELQTKSVENEMYIFGMHIMAKDKYMDEFKISTKRMQNYLYALQSSYNQIAYHNKTHATDLSQTCYYYMYTCHMIDICKLSRVEQMAMLLAGFMHDTDHPGFNNVYMVNTSAPLAIRYNDKAVLESYHAAMGFKIMKGNRQCNIFDNLSKDQYRDFRKLIVELVLSTDMTRHFPDMSQMGVRTSESDFDPSDKDKKLSMEFLFHMADISNPTKPWSICKKWTDLLFIEFFNQGDKERELGMEISFLMDRTTTNVAKAQDGFIKNLIRPAFCILEKVLPELSLNLKYMDENVEKWATKVSQYSVNHHSHMQTKSIKAQREEEDKDDRSDFSEDSFIPEEFSPALNSKISSEQKNGLHHKPGKLPPIQSVQSSDLLSINP
ncbi:unnamed protein product [Moneuplotes crassus]|uniref:PDEase domain-containing protein n=1 Tax=Euplotes crassus TaxID=5936 RepID=A0AAD2DCK8_EUPCR|nr:unnamed protein product [Moneuplotes crassus]